jgi:hypothetical protein
MQPQPPMQTATTAKTSTTTATNLTPPQASTLANPAPFHIVSLKDAYDSGGASWGASKKESFANDRSNHVPSCGRVNSSKGSAGPSDFLRRTNDGKGLDYEIVRFCEYVQKYYTVKVKYGLSLRGNSKNTLATCGLTLM